MNSLPTNNELRFDKMLHNLLKLYHKIVRKAIENKLFQLFLASFSEQKAFFTLFNKLKLSETL